MKLKSLESATKILAEVKALDEKIIALERLAYTCAEGVGCVVFDVSVREKAKEPVVKVGFDGDGSLVTSAAQEHMARMYRLLSEPLFYVDPKDTKKEDAKSSRFELGEIESLTVFGAMLLGLKEQREKHIAKLRDLGFSI